METADDFGTILLSSRAEQPAPSPLNNPIVATQSIFYPSKDPDGF